jgi:hypothetical protein
MPTNANTFNSRVTSEALEKKFRDVFPAQGGAELVQDLFASGVIQPVIDFSSVAEGSSLGQNLQTAWDFSTGANSVSNTTTTIINNTGFWKVSVVLSSNLGPAPNRTSLLRINDGSSTKNIWGVTTVSLSGADAEAVSNAELVVFLRAGDSLEAVSPSTADILDVTYRQIADVNGNLVNPLGFTSS